MNQWQGWENLIARLKADLFPKVSSEYHQQLSEFIDSFFSIMSKDELESYSWKDLLGSILYLWNNLINYNDELAADIRIFNPDKETCGWQSKHTIIQIIQLNTPFMVDSIRIRLNDLGILIHQLLNTDIEITTKSSGNKKRSFGVVHIEVNRIESADSLKSLHNSISAVLADVRRCVHDYRITKEKIQTITENLSNKALKLPESELNEIKAYLYWILNDNFTFLGFEEVKVKREGQKTIIERPTESLLGLFRENLQEKGAISQCLLEPEMDTDFFSDKSLLSFAKASVRSTVHRPAYPDFIILKQFDKQGQVTGEYRILGLYTSPVFNQSIRHIPILREKYKTVINRSGFLPDSHAGKELAQILQVFPREELFQMKEDQLFETAMSILQIQERNQTKVFMRHDRNGLFCSVLVYVPREVYSTELRKKIESILRNHLNAQDAEFFTFFSESVLARIHFILRLTDAVSVDSKLEIISEEVIAATSSWDNDFEELLIKEFQENKGILLFNKFRAGIPTSYKEKFSVKRGVYDVITCESFTTDKTVKISFYQLAKDKENKYLRAKVFNFGEPLPLADQIPLMENLGLRIISEHPYELTNKDREAFWIHDFYAEFSVNNGPFSRDTAEHLQDTFLQTWAKLIENDKFNKLILAGGMNNIQVTMFRAYARYLQQIKFGFSQDFIASVLYNNIDICLLIWEFFQIRFDINADLKEEQRTAKQQQLQQEICTQLEQVSSLTDDRILRRYVELISATLRTNFYQRNPLRTEKCIVFKIATIKLSHVPKPVPEFEIFVYSPRFEAVHLRGGKVARGGLRWSDRREDFRTEILGLLKAQQVKNSVIVPVGAKGGFVCKCLPENDHDAFMKEGIACYKQFIRCLLSVTDNLVKNSVIKPEHTICYDDDDYYLVVAADKGTATFSDIANEISQEHNFWLDDAFASGGSAGYDHKKMGITAKGAWVSVQTHFAEKSIDIQKQTITAIGIGDMSGDVFGNGMLLSKKMVLVAAFNHIHIFIDPNPDTDRAFKERERLFNLPGSGWSDYDKSLISAGGGVFSRNTKSIRITEPMQKRFSVTDKFLTPAELISVLLRSSVDLIWIGGIGTYVKASSESHENVGDHANDALRVNGNQLRCRVIGEGGNLGLTQLGRIEYSLQGGTLNTDFIDNAGGVDCSDHEVNIKILLNPLVAEKKVTTEQRNEILETMTADVAGLVMLNNYRQTRTISLAQMEVKRTNEEFKYLIFQLETQGKLNRAVEFIPNDDQINERIATGKTLTRPELSVLVSYTKAMLKARLLESDLCGDDYLFNEMLTAFPELMRTQYKEALKTHRLRREITATQIANYTCNIAGITLVSRLQHFMNVSPVDIMRTFIIVRDVYNFDSIWSELESLDFTISTQLQHELMITLRTTIRRLTRWLLQIKSIQNKTIKESVDYFQEGVQYLTNNIETLIPQSLRQSLEIRTAKLVKQYVPQHLAIKLSFFSQTPGLLFIVEIMHETQQPLEDVAKAYFRVKEILSLQWILYHISLVETGGNWGARSRENIRDDLTASLKAFVLMLLKGRETEQPIQECIKKWCEKYAQEIDDWNAMLGELRLESKIDLAMISVLSRHLSELCEKSKQVV